ncbi:tyrosine-protein phosphatase [Nocardioides sp. LHD-245]|uniref:tyrosine-protein phosphatase n=1 Tax=Nocardioides sp. LHD-245 TaxID=3051387 RepID=UPI0027DF3D6D|nr:tyrosine-protein phosphatase [Nocardioides sp. LHD-245]
MSSTATTGLPDLANLRDVGGLRTHDGRRTRQGRLLRSGTPFYLDATQSRHLVDGLGLRLRIDLRSRGEVDGATNSHLAAVEREVLLAPIGAGGAGTVPATAAAEHTMMAHYLRYLEHAADSFALIARALADAERLPALLHCTLGKDRTGTVVAVLLSAVGVLDDEIVADYARTEGQNDALLDRLRRLPEYRRRLELLPAESLRAVPESMSLFLAGLQDGYGGGAGYLRSAGVGADVLDRLTGELVEESR